MSFILNQGFFKQTSECYDIAFSTTSATITIPISSEVFNNLRITNNSGNLCFMQVSSVNPGTISHPTPGGTGSTKVFPVPTGQQTFINTGLTAPSDVYVSTISIAGSGSVFLQAGSFL
jgi:hypothetical protein